jgi:hypothetical protein
MMSLTLEAEQRSKDVSLATLFKTHEVMWLGAARKTKAFVRENFPDGALIRRDDVAKALHPIMEVNETLKYYLDSSKLRGKFWIRFFVDLIIDRTWDNLD